MGGSIICITFNKPICENKPQRTIMSEGQLVPREGPSALALSLISTQRTQSSGPIDVEEILGLTLLLHHIPKHLCLLELSMREEEGRPWAEWDR